MPFAIETSDLIRDFGTFRAVDHLSLQVEPGRFLRLPRPQRRWQVHDDQDAHRPAGADERPIRLFGEDTSDPARALAVKRRVGVVPENLALFDNLTAREYLTFVGRMYLMPPDTIRTRAKSCWR
jgi:ABC-2 type transport system ATP-binding protein